MIIKKPQYHKARLRYSQSQRWSDARKALPHAQVPLVNIWARVLQAKPEFATEGSLHKLLDEVDEARLEIERIALAMDKAYVEFAAAVTECWEDARLEAESALQSEEAA